MGRCCIHNNKLSIKTHVEPESSFNVQHLKTFDPHTEALRSLWQGFAYLLFSANSAGIAMAQLLQSGNANISGTHTCADASSFCTQARVAIALGFGAFLTLAISALLTGMRVARWMLSWRPHNILGLWASFNARSPFNKPLLQFLRRVINCFSGYGGSSHEADIHLCLAWKKPPLPFPCVIESEDHSSTPQNCLEGFPLSFLSVWRFSNRSPEAIENVLCASRQQYLGVV